VEQRQELDEQAEALVHALMSAQEEATRWQQAYADMDQRGKALSKELADAVIQPVFPKPLHLALPPLPNPACKITAGARTHRELQLRKENRNPSACMTPSNGSPLKSLAPSPAQSLTNSPVKVVAASLMKPMAAALPMEDTVAPARMAGALM
jgi:hypothetical protein